MKNLCFNLLGTINVDIRLTKRITTLTGDSATGKSYLYDAVSNYVKVNKIDNVLCINVKNTELMNKEELLNKINSIHDGIVIIDQADDIITEYSLWDNIKSDKKNYYILMSRKYYTSFTEWARTIISNNSISICYLLNSFCKEEVWLKTSL